MTHIPAGGERVFSGEGAGSHRPRPFGRVSEPAHAVRRDPGNPRLASRPARLRGREIRRRRRIRARPKSALQTEAFRP
jgi:hypothetical protein